MRNRDKSRDMAKEARRKEKRYGKTANKGRVFSNQEQS